MNNIENNQYWLMGETTKSRNIVYRVSDFLSSEEISNILKNNENRLQQSKMGAFSENGGVLNTSLRKSKMFQLPFRENWNLYSKIESIVNDVNNKNYKFVLTKIQKLQFLKYDVGDFMTLHTDCDFRTTTKLCMIISLSEEEKDYTGGQFLLYDGNRPVTENNGIQHIKMKKGDAIFYPSYYLHEVKPLLTGTRYSIAAWVYGDSPFS
jgi:predicted 2-oxoglutarate/Fe(II)-dependent dioxygenase YbiX